MRCEFPNMGERGLFFLRKDEGWIVVMDPIHRF